MTWSIRSAIAGVLWLVTALLIFFFVFSGWWIYVPFAFAAGGGEPVLILLLAIAVLGASAYLIGRRRAT